MPPKVATRSSLEQVIVIDRLLRLPKPVRMSRLTTALDCCEKTVRRHLAWMKKKLGVRIVRDAKGMTYAPGQPALFSAYLHRMVGF